MKELSLVAYRIKCEGVSKEGGILKADITKEMFFDMTQSWRFKEKPKIFKLKGGM